MKPQKLAFKITFLLFALVMQIIFTTNPASAQCTNFTAAAISESHTNAGYISDVEHSGNDAKTAIVNTGLGSMKVNVWDGSTPGLGWDNGSSQSWVPLAEENAIDPDVVLVEGQDSNNTSTTTWYAIVVYTVFHSSYYRCQWDQYIWDGSNFSEVSGFPTTLNNSLTHFGHYFSAINIDSDRDGNFVIVWYDDDYLNTAIQVNTGTSDVTHPPVLCNANASGVRNTTECALPFLSPDVSIFPAGAENGTTIEYVFLDNSSKKLFIDNDDFDELCHGNSVATVEYEDDVTRDRTFFYPRIASPPNINTAYKYDFSAVVSDGIDIINYTYWSDIDPVNVKKNIYTDGTMDGLCQIENNTLPVVSYNDSATGSIVGWTTDYGGVSGSPYYLFYPTSCVAIKCFLDGKFDPGCSTGYMIIPTTNGSYTTEESYLSLSGRDYVSPVSSPDAIYFYTYFDDYNQDIKYKEVPVINCSLRLRHPSEVLKNGLAVFPNPFQNEFQVDFNSSDEKYKISISDATGKTLLAISGTGNEINKLLKKSCSKVTNGVYILKLISENETEILNQKLVKIN